MNHERLHLILKRMRRRSKRLAGAGRGDEGGGGGGPPPSGGGDGRGGGFGWRGAQENLPRHRARVQRGQGVDAAVEGFVSLAGRLEPLTHGMAAHEARAHLLAG